LTTCLSHDGEIVEPKIKIAKKLWRGISLSTHGVNLIIAFEERPVHFFSFFTADGGQKSEAAVLIPKMDFDLPM